MFSHAVIYAGGGLLLTDWMLDGVRCVFLFLFQFLFGSFFVTSFCCSVSLCLSSSFGRWLLASGRSLVSAPILFLSLNKPSSHDWCMAAAAMNLFSTTLESISSVWHLLCNDPVSKLFESRFCIWRWFRMPVEKIRDGPWEIRNKRSTLILAERMRAVCDQVKKWMNACRVGVMR